MKNISYKKSGVDIDKGNKLVELIKEDIKKTSRPGIMGNIGGFGGLFDLKECGFRDPILVAATDGVGTKLEIAIKEKNYKYIGQDLLAMCINDLAVQGAQPLFFLDYFATSKLDLNQAQEVIKSIATACREANCALIGGETAEMPAMYKKGDFDIAGFAIGAVERENILPKKEKIKEGDIILGLKSSGIHSNGYSLIRKIMKEYKLEYNTKAQFNKDRTYGQEFLIPTKIYTNICYKISSEKLANAFCHITGGGFIENIPRILPDNLDYVIDIDNYDLPPIFEWIKKMANIDNNELFKTFNCGIGMAVILAPENLPELERLLIKEGQEYKILGHIKNKQ